LLLVARAFGDRFQHAAEAETAGFLAWRELTKALQPLADIGTGGCESEHVLELPFGVADAFLFIAELVIYGDYRVLIILKMLPKI